MDLATEKRLQNAVLKAIQEGLVASAHDLSEGGLAVALAESCISGNVGAAVNVASDLRPDFALFSESQSRIVLSATPDKADALKHWIASQGVPYQEIGTVTGSDLTVKINNEQRLQSPVSELAKVWKDAIPCLMA